MKRLVWIVSIVFTAIWLSIGVLIVVGHVDITDHGKCYYHGCGACWRCDP